MFSVIFDEAHCISQWGYSFCPSYAQVVDLGDLVPPKTLFYLTSATMPKLVLADVLSKLHLDRHPDEVLHLRLSNDWPNIYLEVWQMAFAHLSFQDLNFLLPNNLNFDTEKPHKFMIFFDSKLDTQKAVDFLQSRLPKKHIDKILWFHSGMSTEFRTETIEDFKKGDVWGLCCTDAAGMVSHISSILMTADEYFLRVSTCQML